MQRKKRWRTVAMMFALGVLGATPLVHAAEVWHTSTIKWVYTLSTGDVVLVFQTSSPSCLASGPDKYMYIYVGSNGVTLEGRKAMYAAALMAFSTGSLVDVAFDDATASCFINRLLIRNS